MNVRPMLTIAQIIEQFELSRATVRRGIESGKYPGATKDAQGRWLVPVDALVATGTKPRKTWLTGVATEPANEHAHGTHLVADPNEIKVATELAHPQNEHDHELAHRASRIAQLEAELDSEKRLREAAERNANDLRTALRMIEAGSATPKAEDHSASSSHQRRRWWRIR